MTTATSLADERFRKTVDRLRVPEMGTEAVAPLLAALLRLVRPERVLEVGMGYTTPFLAGALAEIQAQTRAESAALAAKTRPYLEGGAPLDERWLNTEPALLTPEYYTRPYTPRLVAVDDLSIPESSSPLVLEVLRELELDRLVTVVNADLRACVRHFPDDFSPIDLAWVDAWECLYFFDNFWELINPDGGLVVMHYLMTYPEGEAFLRYLATLQRANAGELEMVNLLEPHKLAQNSLTILRRTGGVVNRNYTGPDGEVDLASVLDGVRRQRSENHATEEL